MTLTEAASYTKKAFIFIIIFVFVITIVFFAVRAYLNSRPVASPPEEIANLLYEKLPRPILPKSTADSSTFNYALDTEDGSLPKNLPKIIKVYFIPKLGTTLLARNKAKELASQFEFEKGPDIINPTTFKFNDETGGEFIIDMDTGNFKFQRGDKRTEEENEQDSVISDKQIIISEFIEFLSRRNLFPNNLDDLKTSVKYNNPAQKDSEEAFVSIWQKSVDELPIVTEYFTQGLVKATFTKFTDEKFKFSTVNYTYYEIDKENFATYPLKNIRTAFDELKNGNAKVVIKPDSPNISLVKIYLAYYLPEQYTPYLQPVYIFEGEKESFYAVTSAIPDENLESQ